ncbi:Rid family hydrolase [Nakamurella endophytica]|uniref:RidA family protein n=1 Tax=Nakamurella endophytica TaxID=1748367 RepID=A0A917T7W1_9ACTN|nr:Rid family hydrolase [Nakamurella endophytica]GGM13953.1 hypothetical protein GCM10011594_37270 [Nakamurella endophytica]
MTRAHPGDAPPPDGQGTVPTDVHGPVPTDVHGTARFRDATGWQEVGGYSRAVRRGDTVVVSGTTATGPDGAALHPGDTYAQTVECLERVLAAVSALGGTDRDVVRTRVLLAPGASWQEATRAHGERMAAVLPANTTVYVGGLIGDGFLVEVEAEAVLAP